MLSFRVDLRKGNANMARTLRQIRSRLHLLAAHMGKNPSVRAMPTVLTVETTTDCNLHCLTCHRTHHPDAPMRMPMGLFSKIISECDGGVEFVNLFGMGEPLLDRELPEKINLCSENGIGTHIATSAMPLDAAWTRAVLDAGLTAITFSINSTRPDVYRRLHSGGDYGVAIRNIERFLEARRGRRRGPFVTIEMIRTRQTSRECDGMMRRWLRVPGVDAVRIRHDEFGCVSDMPDEADQWAQAPGLCHYLWQGPLLIRADGGMYPCCVSALNGRSAVNAADHSPRDFWKSDFMREVREGHLRGLRDSRLSCDTCRAPKPIPVMSPFSYLATAMQARRAAIYLERISLAHRWKLQRREIQ
jgi:hypothetical protein